LGLKVTGTIIYQIMNSLNRATAPVIVRAFVGGSFCPWVSQSRNERKIKH